MNHHELRRRFTDYFVRQGHTIVKPSNVIPHNDPTLLFTNAGMNQFKDALLGREKRSYTRAANVQPCVRVGGKHNDLDAVGKDGRHLTWFEMMGNWSFGDYYKEEAISFAWDVVTKEFDLDTSKLYASVYKDDDESALLWKKIAGLPDSRIVRLGNVEEGDEENFWSMGPVGPCGPCTELYFDQGESFGQDVVGGETDRFLEFWNVVFMEFNRAEDGTLSPLPMKSVDTGMGLERIAGLMQGVSNVFQASMFTPIIGKICDLTGRDYVGADVANMGVVADHMRSLSFILADGGEFDRAGRGYVLRRILRRAVLHGDFLGMKEPWIHKLVPTVVEATGGYDIAADVQAKAAAAIKAEEEKFFRTLDRGLVYFNRVVDGLKGRQESSIGGADSFQLYDTYGFPVDLTRILAEKQGLEVDAAGFESKLDEQRARSKDAAGFYDAGGWVVLKPDHDQGFAGYGLEELGVSLLRYRDRGDGQVDLLIDRTPFYVEGGGEMSDRGTLKGDRVDIDVLSVAKSDVGVVHSGRVIRGTAAELAEETDLLAVVDLEHRRAKSAHHTATHLLHAALRTLLGPSARQMGSQVTADSLRFDFSSDRALTSAELAQIEADVNARILEDHGVNKLVDVPYKDALELGALAFFSENYGEKVRVLQVPGVSTELCGGNHIDRTAQIGSFQIVGEQSVGAGVRRIEAVTHAAATARSRHLRDLMGDVAHSLNTTPDQLQGRIAQLLDEVKKLQKEREKLVQEALSGSSGGSLEDEIRPVHGVPLLVKAMSVGDANALKQLLDKLRGKRPDALIALVGEADGRGFIIIGQGTDAVKSSGVKAGDLAKAIAGALGAGGGGGRPDFAQTGFKGITPAEAAKTVATVIEAALKK